MATIVNVQDPSTSNNLAIDSSGRIGVNNWPAVQTIQGTVNVALFPSVQPVSGSVDVTDRSLRQLGIVTIASGGVVTNTAPGYTIIQDSTTNANKLKVNSDGSINVSGTVSLPTGAATSAKQPALGTAGAASGDVITVQGIASMTALKVDGSGVTQPGNITQINSAALSNTNPVPSQDIEQANYIALTSPPSATNAGSDTSLTFSQQVNRVIIQNNSPANANFAFDAVASAGSLVLVPGAMLVYPKKCTTLHLFTAAAQNINGSTVGSIAVLGAL